MDNPEVRDNAAGMKSDAELEVAAMTEEEIEEKAPE